MAKGARKTFLNTAQSLGKQAGQEGQVAQGQAGTEYSTLMPQVMKQLSPGGDPAVTAATMGALGSRFGAAKQGIMDTAARTGNAASTNAALDKAALDEGSTAAQTAAGNVAQQHQRAIGTLSKMFGMSEQQVNDMLRNQLAANSAYGSQANSPWMGVLGGAINGAENGAATYFKG